jgi:hypothetical protein
MSKVRLTLFVCQDKDCRKAWGRFTDNSPAKWLKRQVERAGLPYKLNVVETTCQDRCEEAACLHAVCGPAAAQAVRVCCADDADRILAALRTCAETAAASPQYGVPEGIGNRPR